MRRPIISSRRLLPERGFRFMATLRSSRVLLDHIADESPAAPVRVKEAKERGVPVVGTFCVFTPWELVRAIGGVSVSLCSTSEKPIAAAEAHLPRNLCPLIKASYGFALTDTCPYFHFCDIVIGETTCDGKKKMYEYLNRLRPVHVMQLPQTTEGETARALWRAETKRLKDVLESFYGRTITDDALREAIRLKNRERRVLNRFFAVARLDPSPLTGLEILAVSDYLKYSMASEEALSVVEELTAALEEERRLGKGREAEGRKRILITGCPLGKSLHKVIRAVEEQGGGAVVAFENCGNLKSSSDLVDESCPPMEAIADRYLRIPCSCMSPNPRRLEFLSRFCGEYAVDGVVDVILQACHTYSVESFSVREHLKALGIPYIAVETDYSQGDEGQLSTRMNAFLEMI